MKKMILFVFFIFGSSAFAQLSTTPPEGSNWAHVEAIAAGTAMHVDAKHGGGACRMRSADAESLTCTRGSGPVTFARGDVKSIKLAKRGMSTVVGAVIGAGVGAGVGAAFDGSQSGTFIGGKKAESAGIGAVLGVVIFTPIGYFTDFLRGPTVYRAP